MDDSDSGFSDVSDGNFHKANIDALDERGLLEGTECAEGMFCPGDPMKRWTMAVWLVRALDDTEPAAVEESSFDDVDSDNQWLPHVELLAELEVTAGCDTEPLRFCPDDSVSRAQMATFLVRAFNLEAADSAGFTDTVGNFHELNIDALAAAEVTTGCDTESLRYCPGDEVTRAQMATFLVRALALSDAAEETTEEEEAPEPEMTGPKLVANPATVPSAGQYTFTVTGSGWNPGLSVNVIVCTSPNPITSGMSQQQIDQATAPISQNPFGHCNIGSLVVATAGSNGSFTISWTANIGPNAVLAGGDIARTQSALVPIFIGS